MFNTRQDLALGSAIGSKFIGHDDPRRVAQALQQLAKEALGRLLVATALHQHNEHVPALINRSPEVVQFAADADEYFIQKPFVSRLRPAPPECLREGPAEAQAPFAYGLVADLNASRRQDQFDLPQAEAEAVIQ